MANELKPFLISAPEGYEKQVKVVLARMKPLYAKLGYEATVLFQPQARSLWSANNGKYDAELARVAGIEQEYQNLKPLTEPTIEFSFGLVHHVDEASIPQGLADINPAEAVSGLGLKFLENYFKGQPFEAIESYDRMIKMVELKRVRFALGGYAALRGSVGKSELTVLKPEPIAREYLFHYVHKRHSRLIEPLSNLLKSVNQSKGIIGAQ